MIRAWMLPEHFNAEPSPADNFWYPVKPAPKDGMIKGWFILEEDAEMLLRMKRLKKLSEDLYDSDSLIIKEKFGKGE